MVRVKCCSFGLVGLHDFQLTFLLVKDACGDSFDNSAIRWKLQSPTTMLHEPRTDQDVSKAITGAGDTLIALFFTSPT